MEIIDMNRNYRALELDKILQLLSNEVSSLETKELALNLRPVHKATQVRSLLEETDAAFILSAKFGTPSFFGLKNVVNPLRRAQAGASLGMKELLDIAATLRTIRTLRQWRSKGEGIKTVLDSRFYVLCDNRDIEERISTAIMSEDEMADNASSELASIRRKIKNASTSVRERLDKIIRSQTHQKHLQDAIVTMRSGRFVVPVKTEHRGEVPGLVHDTSSSGATVFIEPMAVVEANNEIRVLQGRELEEINRILRELSALVGEIADNTIESFGYALELDLIFAKANLAYKMKATIPEINEDGVTVLNKARHPLIDKNKVVPTDISLGEGFDTLIITGPNTGGKTVSLKTLGLLTLMAMCGLMIPAAEKSKISVFKDILVDIGDEQSIEQSLSTFSSHMVNIIEILKLADENSLVLLDELGAGTDPIEGAALATSIIEELRSKGAKLACTTHYAELKAFALQTHGVENGSCEFDVSTLRPTYRLLIGVPGKSNAFAITTRLGMREKIVSRAREYVSQENTRFEDVVEKLEKSRLDMESEIKKAEDKRKAAELRADEAEKLKAEAEKLAAEEIEKARKQAEDIVATTRVKSDMILNELEDMKKKRSNLTSEQQAKMRAMMKDMEDSANPISKRRDEKYILPRPLVEGDNVLIYDIDKKAIVLEEPKGDTVLVQAGIIKTRVKLSNLRLINQEKVKKPEVKGTRTVTRTNVTTSATTEVDLRGKTVEEALMDVDSAIDHASLGGIKNLTIIHGKGTGALRSAVQQHLRHHPTIKTYRLGVYGEGESGVTIAELK